MVMKISFEFRPHSSFLASSLAPLVLVSFFLYLLIGFSTRSHSCYSIMWMTPACSGTAAAIWMAVHYYFWPYQIIEVALESPAYFCTFPPSLTSYSQSSCSASGFTYSDPLKETRNSADLHACFLSRLVTSKTTPLDFSSKAPSYWFHLLVRYLHHNCVSLYLGAFT